MTAGLQTFNADGTIALDATFGVPKFLKVIPIPNGASQGNEYIPEWEIQQPWFVAITTTIQTPLYSPPKVWVEGAYLKWNKLRTTPAGQAIIVGHR